jgi:hypothetical protein
MDGGVIAWHGGQIELRVIEPSEGAISQEGALARLRDTFMPEAPFPVTAVHFGILRARYPARGLPNGDTEPLYWDCEVWAITLTTVGPQVSRGPHMHREALMLPAIVQRDTRYFLDATSGDRLFAMRG